MSDFLMLVMWNGATATVTVGVGSTTITGFEVFAPGSGYVGGETLTVEGFSWF